ncbi:hypothetical protein MMC28_002256 [Mycoblastus sanguinarius]|nr:hypothetical protein [Mycoblastus sanguinarius]
MVTAIGLGSLITQASGIHNRLDPYHTSRTAEHLGTWIRRQPKKAFYRLAQPTPVGPVIHAKLVDGFCGLNDLGVSRLPLERPGKASWTALLAIFHEQAPSPVYTSGSKAYKHRTKTGFGIEHVEEKAGTYGLDIEAGLCSRQGLSWTSLQTRPLTRHNSTTCIAISRTALITILALCNSRTMFRYSDASGHRASYASYCGHFYIEWPLGAPAVVHFHPHDSHSTSTDVYPLVFRVRVNKCVQMMAGVITSADGTSFQCAFSGRKPPGVWILEYMRKGFPGAHGSRHLYNLMGGKVYEVDFLLARRLDADAPPDALELRLPSTDKGTQLSMLVPQTEQGVLEHTMDCLPWSSLSWSIHRGLRDILVAYAKPTMDKFRPNLASRLRAFINEQPYQLEANGWSAEFVKGSMAELAANSVLAGSGNSGDSVRVVTDAALLLSAKDSMELDETEFWRKERHELSKEAWLSTNAIVALTKCFVLEWSNEFDYQMYHDLPPELLFH